MFFVGFFSRVFLSKEEVVARREGALGPSYSCSLLLLLLLLLLDELTDVTGCVLLNPQVCVSGNRPRLPPGDRAEAAAIPVGCGR